MWESCKGSVWESVKNCSSVCKEAGTRDWISRVARAASRQIDAHVPSMPEVEVSHQLFTLGQKSQAGQVVCSWLELANQPSREVKPPEHLVWQNMTFHIPSYPTIYIPLYPRFRERVSRENFERETLEKTRLTHPQSSHRDSSNSFTFFLSIVKS